MGVPELRLITLKARCPDTEYSEEFLQGMINRITTGFLKYGALDDPAKNVNWLACARQRIEEYHKTKNTEFLIDAGNFIMFEFLHPQLPDAYFKGTDSHESPGIITLEGIVERKT